MYIRLILASAISLALGLTLAVSARAQTEEAPPPAELKSLIADLDSDDERTRLIAASSIGKLGPRAKDAVPQLVELLEDDEDSIRMAGVLALAKIGPEAKPALPELQKLKNDPNQHLSKAAHLAVEAIEPSLSTKTKSWLSSVYVIWGGSVVAIALVALGVLAWRRKSGPAPAGTTQRPPAAPKPQEPASSKPEPAAASNNGSAAVPVPERRRVSRPLGSYEEYAKEQRDARDSHDAAKLAFTRAQEDLKAITDRQIEIGRQLESSEVAGDPDRLLALRSEAEKMGAEHYHYFVRVKAFEIKYLYVLLEGATTANEELRARSAESIRQKWEDLRQLCMFPVKIMWENGQWSRRPAGESVDVTDLRAHLATFGVTLPENFASLEV